jgi:hypothetical protein
MSMSKRRTTARAKIGALSRCIKNGERQPDDPEYLAAKRDLAATSIEEYIERTIAKAPPLTAEQSTQLAELLKPVRVKPPAKTPPKRAPKRGGVSRRSA